MNFTLMTISIFRFITSKNVPRQIILMKVFLLAMGIRYCRFSLFLTTIEFDSSSEDLQLFQSTITKLKETNTNASLTA